eukprot:Platyproteum_vivax@DN6446_c0_g1_i1.p1
MQSEKIMGEEDEKIWDFYKNREQGADGSEASSQVDNAEAARSNSSGNLDVIDKTQINGYEGEYPLQNYGDTYYLQNLKKYYPDYYLQYNVDQFNNESNYENEAYEPPPDDGEVGPPSISPPNNFYYHDRKIYGRHVTRCRSENVICQGRGPAIQSVYRHSKTQSAKLDRDKKSKKHSTSWKRIAFQRTQLDQRMLAAMNAHDCGIPNYNIRRFISCTVPVGLGDVHSPVEVYDTQVIKDYTLGHLWDGMQEASTFGVEISSGNENGFFSSCGYIPSLSALVMWPKEGSDLHKLIGSKPAVRWLEDRPPYLRKSVYASVADMMPKEQNKEKKEAT